MKGQKQSLQFSSSGKAGTLVVSDNKIARLDECNGKPNQHWKKRLYLKENHKFITPIANVHIGKKLLQHQLHGDLSLVPLRPSTRNKQQPRKVIESIPTDLHKRREDLMVLSFE